MKKIKVPHDIREHKSKFKFFTYRQWVAIIGALALPFLINRQMTLMRFSQLVRNIVNYSLLTIIGGIGFFKYKGLMFESLLLKIIETFFQKKYKKRDQEGGSLNV